MRKTGCWAALVAVFCVFAGHASSASAAFPGENGRIAFYSAQFEGCCEGNLVGGIRTIESDGSGETLLIEGATEPAWSADGSKLAYVRSAGEVYDVYTANADGSGERRLTDDGHLDLGGTSQIWVMAADGTGARRVTSLPAGSNARSPRWSPLGDAGWQPGASADEVMLRAERDAKGDGRVYTIAFEVADAGGAKCTGAATVAVPRHK